MVHALICDDYEPICNLITVVLAGMGMTISTAGSGRQALDVVQYTRPDLIISDIDMPELDGISLFNMLRSDATGLAQVPFILMSSLDRKGEALEAGCVYFLTKPFSIDDVRHIVRLALSGGEGVS